ncbi:precorrin-3B C(17)-methyltransferase [Hippea maritima]|uniref:Precorrin-3B C17-methyltransferase n=1 Tax=Hippea maritima (strain ATCC 700847 / DSM 10411 / MH2) TaxID=760142 RepID=F2LU85_HIPMA|nr:precorrin-3B C(17)-methyltransferase [Hippea maritima]AEA34548.1 precorrin-3B C17-methyltransferase [Hippea maritima DSM 10411]
MAYKLFVVGIGPGDLELLTIKAKRAIEESYAICGYSTYIQQIEGLIKDKTVFSNGMGGEIERVKKAIAFAETGNTTSIISGGDSSLYGMASVVIQLAPDWIDIEIIPGITAALAVSARIGAPISDDLAIISMSDLLTPWEVIQKRIEAVNVGDFVCAIYNPKSRKRDWQLKYALDSFFKQRGDLWCASVKNCCKEKELIKIDRISNFDYNFVDMATTVIVGNTKTQFKNGNLITPRGYKVV